MAGLKANVEGNELSHTSVGRHSAGVKDKIVWQSRKWLNMEWSDEPGIHIQEKWKEYVSRKLW